MADGKVIYEVRADDSNLDNDLDNSNKKVEKSTNKLTENAAKTSKVIGTSFLAIGAAAVGVGVATVKGANDMDVAMNSFIASTGTATAETERYQSILEDIYANNYGESFEDIANSMATVRKTLGDLPDDQLKSVTESAYALADTFEYDIAESTRAAKALMENFGTSGEDAMSLIAKGAQDGLDYSGELLDSISEYSVQFAKVGLGADDMFNIFKAGADSGAFNLDKVGDAVKEFAIRAIDGSKTTIGGFEEIGLNADAMAAKMAAGGESAKSAYQETIKALADMTDPLQQNAAAVALFGTQAEDLGTEAIKALANVSDAAYDSADAMGAIKEVKYDDMGSMLEGLTRSLELLLIPLGEELIPILTDLIQQVMPVLQEMLPPLIDFIMQIFDAIAPIISEVLPILMDLLKALAPLFMQIIELLMPLIEMFLELLPPIVAIITDALIPLISMIVDLLIPVFEILAEHIGNIMNFVIDIVGSRIIMIKDIFANLIDFVQNIFAGNWAGAWENIKNIFAASVEGMASMLKAPLNFMIDTLNSFIDGINRIDIPDWVPVVGGKGISLPKIPRLKVGMDYVPSDYFPAYLDEGEAVLTKGEANIWRGMSGNLKNLSQPINSTTQSLNFDSVGISKSDIKDAFKEAIKEIPAQDTVIQLGYEEVARAANKGNVILETRYGK